MITPIRMQNINFQGDITYLDKEGAAQTIATCPKQYQAPIVNGLNSITTTVKNNATDDTSLVLDVYPYGNYDRNLDWHYGVVIGIGEKSEQPKYKGLPAEYYTANVIEIDSKKSPETVQDEIEDAFADMKEETLSLYGKTGFDYFKSLFAKKHSKPVKLDGTADDILNKLA